MGDYCCDVLGPFIEDALAATEKRIKEEIEKTDINSFVVLFDEIRELKGLLEPVARTRDIAQSATRDFWTCSDCGTVLGHANLFGKGGDKWSRFPFYCPGCGKKTGYNAVRLSKSREQVAYIEGGD